MTNAEALNFLRERQPMPGDWDPMPGDWDLTQQEADTYCEVLQHFEQHHDSRCLPLFIHSVSPETGLGMYESIAFILMAHDRDEVVPHLRNGLLHGNDGVKARCCWWAADANAWELEEQIRPLAAHPDVEIRECALAFLELKREQLQSQNRFTVR